MRIHAISFLVRVVSWEYPIFLSCLLASLCNLLLCACSVISEIAGVYNTDRQSHMMLDLAGIDYSKALRNMFACTLVHSLVTNAE